MAYTSLLGELYTRLAAKPRHEACRIFDCRNPLGSLFKDLKCSLENLNGGGELDIGTLTTLVTHPPAIINCINDAKIAYPSRFDEHLLDEALKLGLKIYSSPINAISDVLNLETKLKANNEELLESIFEQIGDRDQFWAANPEKCTRVSSSLASEYSGKDILLIAIARQAIPHGIDVYLRFCDISNSQDSEFYVIRLSSYDLGDKEPRVTQPEIEHIRKLSINRPIVIIDDVKCRGITCKAIERFFMETFDKRINFREIIYFPSLF